MRGPCSVCGDIAAILRRGMCGVHYRRVMRHGDPHKLLVRPLGSGTPNNKGYWMHEINGRNVLRHVLIAEQALGKRLPKGAQVHHVDEDRSNDRNDNLVICPNASYHQLLHRRQRALDACGNANWRKCHICKQYDAPSRLRFYEASGLVRHIECWRAQYKAQKEAA